MALLFRDDGRARVAGDLRIFFEPHGTTAEIFDDWCGWEPGCTHALLAGTRPPCINELAELSMRLGEPLERYIRVANADYPPWHPDPSPPRS